MKKKLEADLISLAHKILQLKNKEDVAVLQQEALKLYEKLSVLRFVEEHFESGEPTIGREIIEEKLEAYEPVQQTASEEKPESSKISAAADVASVIEQLAASKSVADDELDEIYDVEEPETVSEESEPETEEDVTEAEESATLEVESPTFETAVALEQPEAQKEAEAATAEESPENEPEEETKEETVSTDPFAPVFQLDFDAPPAPANKYDEPAPSFTFDDLLGKDYADPVFVTPDELHQETSAKSEEKTEPAWTQPIAEETAKTEEAKPEVDDIWSRRPFETKPEFDKPIGSSGTLNDKLSKGITIGLNDRIAFMKNLFNNSSEDYNRVLSQLMTIDTYSEARRFIQEMVKPDYNNWQGKEEFEERFMEIVEKRFL
ncbi:hypothetical protein [Flavobacterium silvaticum]|uniref:Uncharacterized protein n=1 Tax=Flavobacterium silvaticum TaxID=1852020 RepID=A0A972FL37_9FLAO|nr:hypothetical protein [Flavobacterium silvaticum]NMH27723.1 hypothetical protein [Flavobacterium silvaticum]